MTEAELAFVRAAFERSREWLQAALDHDFGTHNLDDVWELLASGVAQIWPMPHAVMVTTIDRYPRKYVLRGWLSGGDLNEIKAEEPKIRAWAERNGFDAIVIGGRAGWLRAFEGYEKAATVIVRHLR